MSRRCRPRRSRPGTSGCRPAGPRCRGRTWPVNDMKSSPCANATANVHGRQLARLHLNPRPLCAVSGIRLGGACGAAARRQRRPAALGRPRPSHAGPHLRSPQIKAAHTACIGAPRGRLPRHPSVQLAVAASRAPFGRRQGRSAFADPGPGTHSHRIGACEDDGQEQDGLEPSLRCRCLQGRWHRCRVSPGWWAGAPLVYTAAGMRLSSGSMD